MEDSFRYYLLDCYHFLSLGIAANPPILLLKSTIAAARNPEDHCTGPLRPGNVLGWPGLRGACGACSTVAPLN